MTYTYDRNWGCRITAEMTFRGLRVLVLENELLRVSVLLDKGSDIYEFLHKPTDTDFLWRSPNPVRPPQTFVPSSGKQDGFFSDYYHGGWQEIFPTGGVACDYHGVEIGQHGEVSLMPWDCVITRDTPDQVSAKLSVRTCRTPFFLEKTLTLNRNSAVLHIEETASNEGCETLEFMWGHHPAFGAPFLSEACRIDIPATRVEVHPSDDDGRPRVLPGTSHESWPIVKDRDGNDFDLSKVPAPDALTHEMCYLLGLTDGWYAITNTEKKVGFGMSFDRELFKVVWLWEVFGGGYGFPWYGRTYNLALEPWTSWPGGLRNSLARRAVMQIGAGESISTKLAAVAYQGFDRVAGISRDGVVK